MYKFKMYELLIRTILLSLWRFAAGVNGTYEFDNFKPIDNCDVTILIIDNRYLFSKSIGARDAAAVQG